MKVSQKQAGAHERITEGQPESLRLVSVFAASVADAVGILQELTSFPTGGNLQPSPHVTKSSRLSLDICPTEMSAAQFSSVTQLCLTLCNPVDCSTPGLPVHHQFQELTQTHVRRVGDAVHLAHSFTKGTHGSTSRSLLQNSLERARVPTGKKTNEQQPYSHSVEHCVQYREQSAGARDTE